MMNPYALQDSIERDREDEDEAFENWAALAGVDTNEVGAWETFEAARRD